MNSSTLELRNNSSAWIATGTNITLNAGSSHLKFINNTNATSVLNSFDGAKFNIITNENSVGPLMMTGNFEAVKIHGKGDLQLAGNLIMDTLILEASTKHIFLANGTQLINKYFLANTGVCKAIGSISATTILNDPTAQANVNLGPSATYLVRGFTLESIKSLTSVPLITSSCVNVGNNSNIQFPAGIGNNLYWVGGSGNWSDINHWSFINDGVYPPIGGGCVPTPFDNVYFNENSGFTPNNNVVNLDVATSYCNSMTWKNANSTPEIKGDYLANLLHVFGSLELQNDMKYMVGSTHFKSNFPVTIKTNGAYIGDTSTLVSQYRGDLYFEGEGEYLLLDGLKLGNPKDVVTGNIEFSKGTLKFGSHSHYINGFHALSTANRSLFLESSKIYLKARGGNVWRYINSNLDAGTSHIFITGLMNSVDVGLQTGNGHSYYHVTFTNPLSLNGAIRGSAFIQKLTFIGNGNLQTTFEVDSLILTPKHQYVFNANQTIKINKFIQGSGETCDEYIELNSSSATAISTIQFTPSTFVDLSRLIVTNIRATGAPLVLNNSVDQGGNTGITFATSPTPNTLYWVGGAGNWNDKNHWSTINNGIYPSASGCIPLPIDNVVFNSNSGFSSSTDIVELDSYNAYCNSMLWDIGIPFSPMIRGYESTNVLTIKGSLTILSPILFHVGNINFNSNNLGNTISSVSFIGDGAGGTSQNKGNITFNGIGSWTFMSNINNRTGSITFTKGIIDLNGHILETAQFASPAGQYRELHIINSTIKTTGFYRYTGATKLLSAYNSHIYSNGQFFGDALNQYHNITATANVNGPIRASHLTLANSVTLSANNFLDTLTFTAGFAYRIAAGTVQTVNKMLYPNGNPCNRVSITSSNQGSSYKLNVLAGSSVFNFVTIGDADASGSFTTLRKGSQSIDNGGNTNIVFDPYDPTSTIDGFGAAVQNLFCITDTLLSAASFFPAPSTLFLWHDNSTRDTLRIHGPGTYSLTVTYAPGCVVNDAVTFTFDDTCSAFLPILLKDFNVNNKECSNVVYWSTFAEINNAYFEVYRSKNGVEWTLIHTEKGSGNSNKIEQYKYIDNDVLSNGTYYYYLKQIDYNGRYETFPLKSVNVNTCVNSVTVYPNPASGLVNIKWDNTQTIISSYNVIDMLGRVLVVKSQVNNSGLEQIDVSSFAEGSYVILLRNEEGVVSNEKFVVVK